MRYKYFVGFEHQKIHSAFIKKIFPGDDVVFASDDKTSEFPNSIFEHDGSDVVWFFNDLYINLHTRLKGRQILVGHGLGFGRFMTKERAHCINLYIDHVFSTGVTCEEFRIDAGTDPSKICRIGYTYPFLVPKIKTESNNILFSSSYFKNWDHYSNLNRILEHLDDTYTGFFTYHPQTPKSLIEPLLETCNSKKNISIVSTQEELLVALAKCDRGVFGGVTSVAATFMFFSKPIIYVRGRVGINPLKGLGWRRIKKLTDHPIFDKHLEECVKVSNWKTLTPEVLNSAKASHSAREIFYPWNTDESEVTQRIKQCIDNLESQYSNI
jgi:hypothetical protein